VPDRSGNGGGRLTKHNAFRHNKTRRIDKNKKLRHLRLHFRCRYDGVAALGVLGADVRPPVQR
jgi:hypothetical protein